MNATEWAEELKQSLADGPGAPALLTVAACRDTMGCHALIETARHAVNTAGWSLYELTAEQVEGNPLPLRDTGFLILSEVVAPIAPAVANPVAAFQHLVRRGLPVGLPVVGSIEGIASLHKDPALGFLDRAESVIQDE